MDYIEVTAKFDTTGRILPISFMWAGRRINIDRVSDARPAASLKHGGQGIRYTCLTGSKNYYLFCDEGKWFLEIMDI
jgi:hypothetical protein